MNKKFLKNNPFVIEQLEQRLLFSADITPFPIDGGQPYEDNLVSAAVIETTQNPDMLQSHDSLSAEHKRLELLFVDTRVQDYQKLVDDVLANQEDGLRIDVVVLDSSRDGIEQISETLSRYENLDAIHIVSHGSDGAVQMGSTWLGMNNLDSYAGAIEGWKDAVTGKADILFYGCDLASGDNGLALINNLTLLTGADVAASTDLTGQRELGGNWTLEYTTGNIEAGIAIDAAAQQTWAGTLAVSTGNSDSAATPGAATSLTFSHTVNSGANGLLVVEVATANNVSVSSVTYGGTALTFLSSDATSSGEVRVELWYLKSPTWGTADIVVDLPSIEKFVAGATSFLGVDQTTPFGTPVTATGNNLPTTVTVTSASDRIVLDFAGALNVLSSTVGAGQTQLWTNQNGTQLSDIWGVSSTEAGAASVTMSQSFTSSGFAADKWAALAVSINPAANSAPTISGSAAGQTVNDNATIPPFSGVTIGDVDSPAQTLTVSVTLDSAAKGIFSTLNGFTDAGGGVYTFSGTAAAATSAIQGMVFNPADNRGAPASTETTTFTISANDGIASAVTDNTTTVISNSVNDAPTASNNTVTTIEDITYTFTAADFSFSDIDGDGLAQVQITSLETAGSLQLSGVDVALNDVITVANINAGSLTFIPASNANGAGYASFTFKVHDGTAYSASAYTMIVNVTAVNDAPTAVNNTVATIEDITYTFTAADFSFSDIDGDGLAQVQITSLETAGSLQLSGVDVALNDIITVADINAGSLKFIPAANVNGAGYASFTFKVHDGTAYSASAYTMIVNVTAVNDTPTAANNTVTTVEDITYTFTAADFSFSDIDGDGLAQVQITSLETAGSLQLSGVDIALNDVITVADINAGSLTFIPASNANGAGYTSFTFKVHDGTAYSASAYTMTVNVTAVNDAPTAVNNTVTANEDTALIISASDLLSNDSDIEGNILTITGFSQPARGTVVNNGNGTFTYTPENGFYGTDSFTYTINDGNGSTDIGAVIIDITPVGDTPQVRNIFTSLNTQSGLIVINRNADDGAEVTHFRISGITSGTLYLADGVTQINNGDYITFAQGQAGVRFTPSSAGGFVNYSFFVESSQDGLTVAAQSGKAFSNITIIAPSVPPASATPDAPIDTSPNISAPEESDKENSDMKAVPILSKVSAKTPDTAFFAAVDPVSTIRGQASADSLNDPGRSAGPKDVLAEHEGPGNKGISTIPVLHDESQNLILNRLQNLRQSTLRELSSIKAYRNLKNALDALKNETSRHIQLDKVVVGSAIAMSTSLSAGYVIWMIRGGMLVSSVLSSLPAWQIMDPLPILGRTKDNSDTDDKESLESIIKDGSANDDNKDHAQDDPASDDKKTPRQ